MVLVAKISKGSRMDQVYIPKNRSGFSIGSYVTLKPLEEEQVIEKPYSYNIKSIEPIKLEIIKEIIKIVDNEVNNESIIITGSFLDEGFNFNDVDVIVISEDNVNEKIIEKRIWNKLKVENHVIHFNRESFQKALRTDPIWRMMLGRCISTKRLSPIPKRSINYKLLDLGLLKSETLIGNFDYLTGRKKYSLIRNLIAIKLFLREEKITKNRVDNEIKKIFNVKIKDIKDNMLEKDKFLKKYRVAYKSTFEEILKGIQDGSKQE